MAPRNTGTRSPKSSDKKSERSSKKKFEKPSKSTNPSGKIGDFSKFIKKDKTKKLKSPNQEFGKKRPEDDETRVRSKHKLVKNEAAIAERKQAKKSDDLMRLNKYLAHAGICSRRDADVIIQSGAVTVNGVSVTEMGYKVTPTDKVVMDGQLLKTEKLQYVLLNKPKDFVTTTSDPDNKKTVMELVKHACKERIYPVGRLDVKTTGLLLFTNDGELAKKLTHPKHSVNKLYHVFLDKSLSGGDLLKLRQGLELEDGLIKPDNVEYVVGGDGKTEVGIQIHSGKNRIVRRMFEHLGYKVKKLDRVIFAGLNKKDLPRGKWRMLTPKEIDFLRML
jgi:23S rRNA pseudouridine2605 synthase